jgi:hypothetical protein
MLYRVYLAWAGFELTTLVVIDTDCMGSCKSNYHMITTTTALMCYEWSFVARCMTNFSYRIYCIDFLYQSKHLSQSTYHVISCTNLNICPKVHTTFLPKWFIVCVLVMIIAEILLTWLYVSEWLLFNAKWAILQI